MSDLARSWDALPTGARVTLARLDRLPDVLTVYSHGLAHPQHLGQGHSTRVTGDDDLLIFAVELVNSRSA